MGFLQPTHNVWSSDSAGDEGKLNEKSLAWHRTTSRLHLVIPTGGLNPDVRDELFRTSCRTCTAARAQKAQALLAAFAAASAVLLFVYICSLSIRRGKAALPFGRTLAASDDDEDSGESGSCVRDIDKAQGHAPHSYPFPSPYVPLSVESGHTDTSPALGRTSTVPRKRISSAATQRVNEAGEWASVKGNEKENVILEREAKLPRLEVPVQDIPPGHPPIPLDPALDILIDSMLSEIEDPLSEDIWLLDDDETRLTSSAVQIDRAEPVEWHGNRQSPSPCAQADQITPGVSGALSVLDGSEASDSTPLGFFESVLSESSHSGQHVLHEWLLSEAAQDLGEALSLMASSGMHSALPASSGEPEGAATGHGSLRTGTTESVMDPRVDGYATPQSDSSSEAADTSLRAPAAEPSTALEHGMATTAVETTVLRSSLPSTSGTIATQDSVGSMAEASLPAVEQAEQLLSSRAQSATEGLTTSFKWIKAMFGRNYDSALKMHPFYRHPGRQQGLIGRSFSEERAASSRTSHTSLVPILSECRYLFKKLWLTKEELENLLDYTERLCEYASTSMPAHDRATTTAFAVETLGRVFLILDTLHCAAEVLGGCSKKDSWWPSIVLHIESARYRGGSRVRKAPWSAPILKALDVGLDYFRIGQRPPLQLVVGLKLALFLSPLSTRFNVSKWDPWREDAKEWLESEESSVQASKQPPKESTSRRL